MSHPRPPASDLLPLLAAAFPQTFFIDPKQVRPLKIHIHRDLNAWRKSEPRPTAISLIPLRRFLHGYTQRTAYLKALARGERRIDLTGAVVDDDRPEFIRAPVRQELTRRQALRRGTAGHRKAAPANPAAALLPRLAAAFPQTFLADPKLVRPLKVCLYRDVLRQDVDGTLPEGIDREVLKAFLRGYGKRTAYLNAVARGLGRLDLTGAVVATTIPDVLRQQARAECNAARRHGLPRPLRPRRLPQREFGLRREEAIKFQPAYADQGDTLRLKPSWTKGGKARAIPIRTATQRAVLDRAHQLAGDGALIPPERTYREQLRVYERHTANAGLSKLHGLRHAYAQRRYEELTGWKAPAAGGPTARQLTPAQKRGDHEARQLISRELGHEREQVTAVYLGR